MNQVTARLRSFIKRETPRLSGDEVHVQLSRFAGVRETAAPVGRLEYVKDRMAATMWPSFNLVGTPYRKNICHGFVALAARQRMEPTDRIWLYGVVHPEWVWHSVLSDKNNNLLIDTFRRRGGFLEQMGYLLGSEDMEDTEGAEHLDLIQCISVGALCNEYKPSVRVGGGSPVAV